MQIDIKATEPNSNITIQDKEASVSIKTITGSLIQNEEYTTKIETPLTSIVLTGFGEESIPNPGLFRRAFDQLDLLDESKFNLEPLKLETVNVNELFIKVVNFNRLFEEYKITTDEVSIQSSFNRSFTELLDATDDVFGEANIDDDQYATFIKILKDHSETTDVKTVDLDKPLIDQSTAAITLFRKLVGKNHNDLADSIDEPRLRVTKPFTDSFSYFDTNSKFIEKVRINYGLTIDLNVKDISKNTIDNINSISITSVLLGKILNDTTITSDEVITEWNVSRLFTDLVNSNEVISFNLDFNLETESSALEELTVNFDKALLSSTLNNDILTFSTDKVLTDNYTNIDTILFEFTKDHSDNSFIADNSTLFVNKGLENLSVVTDLFDRIVVYNKDLFDAADATDDYCEICPDDEQNAFFGKALRDDPVLTDLLSFSLDFNLTDNFLAIDEKSLNLDKIVDFDLVQKSDITTFEYGKFEEENLIASEEQLFNIDKTLLDNIYLSDLIDLQVDFIRDLEDSILNTDELILNLDKAFEELTLNYDEILLVTDFNRSFDESLISLDEFAISTLKETNEDLFTSDLFNRQVDYIRTPIENIILSEELSFDSSIVLSDNFSYSEYLLFVADFNRSFTSDVTLNNPLAFDLSLVKEDLAINSELLSFEYYLNPDIFDHLVIPLDDLTKDFSKLDEENILTTELFIVNLDKYLFSNGTVNEEFNRQVDYLRSFGDEKYTTDFQVIGFNKDLNNEVILLDDFSTVTDFNRLIDNTINLNEEPIFDLSTIKDDNSIINDVSFITNNKEFNETKEAEDTSVLSIFAELSDFTQSVVDAFEYFRFTNKLLDNSIALSNTGFANNQNYFNEDYVEPGYVGDNTYFAT